MERIVDVVYRISFRILCDRVDSEDVTRRVLSDALHRGVVFDGSEAVTDWFVRQACLRCRRRIVSRRVLWLLEERSAVFVRASPRVEEHDDYVTKQAWQVYCRAVFGMPPMWTISYVLCALEDFSTDRAASVLKQSRARVERNLEKATASIRAELAVYGSAGLYRNFVSFIRRVDEARKPQAADLLKEYSDSAL